MTLPRLAVVTSLLLLSAAGPQVLLTAITGGGPIPAVQLAPGGYFEWLVRLEGPNGRCTGSLISDGWVLTAGHCQTSTTAFIGDDPTGIAIAEVELHPQFIAGQVQFDAALLRLAVPSVIRPVSRPSAILSMTAGRELTLAGWGPTSAAGDLPVEPSAGSATVIAADNELIQTGPPGVGCNGDSGGPMLFRGSIVGVIAAGDAECSAFSVGARFSELQEWVDAIAGSGSINRRPVVRNGELTVIAGAIFELPIEFSDPDSPMGWADITAFTPGSLVVVSCATEIIPTVCRLMAPAGTAGDLEFRYTVSDGQRSTAARWIIHVLMGPEPPVAHGHEFQAVPGIPRQLTLVAVDPNGDSLTFAIVTPPAHGVLSNCTTGSCSYTAHAGYAGPDSFTWVASDGALSSNVATTTIEVQPAQAPQVQPGSAQAVNNTPVDILMEASDANGDPLSYTITTPPQHGTLVDCIDNFCSYVADEGFLGSDAFTWRASDGVLTSAEARFTIDVFAHYPPFADDQNVVSKSNTFQIALEGGDPDGSAVTATVVTPPQHGVLTCAALVCEYSAPPHFTGADSFTWRVSDGELVSRVATAFLEIHNSATWRVTPPPPDFGYTLASIIAGPDATVTQALFFGREGSAGTFAGAADAIGLAGGVILGTGRVADAVGPNLEDLTSTDNDWSGDPAVGEESEDAAVLTFNLVPTSSTFTVRYVFASEEYNDGVGFANDAVAITVNQQNCALINGEQVSVNAINHGNALLGIPASNPDFLIANPRGSGTVDTEMNGVTVVLTCTASVTPGESHQVKIVVADRPDDRGDSVLFIEGTVPDNAPPTLAPLANITRAAEGAAGAVVTFAVSGHDAEDGVLAAQCLPATGSMFAIGETTVNCTVTDHAGATATGAFTVTVTEPAAPGAMSGDGFVRDAGSRYQFSFDARESDRGERARVSLRITADAAKGNGKARDDRFESRTVTFIAFSDDPDVRYRPRRPQVDTVLFSGIGEWNGTGGFRYEVSAQDEAEAGRRHRESIRMTVWSAAGEVVASFSGEVDGGAIRSKRLKH